MIACIMNFVWIKANSIAYNLDMFSEVSCQDMFSGMIYNTQPIIGSIDTYPDDSRVFMFLKSHCHLEQLSFGTRREFKFELSITTTNDNMFHA